MMTDTALFFHIDFGHILGNFKSKYGVKRERAPFVFTHSMKAVMELDGEYDTFVHLCCEIYNILRANASVLVSLCSLAIPCNLPELQREEDVSWIYEKLLVHANDEEAAAHFTKMLEESLACTATRLNDAAHVSNFHSHFCLHPCPRISPVSLSPVPKKDAGSRVTCFDADDTKHIEKSFVDQRVL